MTKTLLIIALITCLLYSGNVSTIRLLKSNVITTPSTMSHLVAKRESESSPMIDMYRSQSIVYYTNFNVIGPSYFKIKHNKFNALVVSSSKRGKTYIISPYNFSALNNGTFSSEQYVDAYNKTTLGYSSLTNSLYVMDTRYYSRKFIADVSIEYLIDAESGWAPTTLYFRIDNTILSSDTSFWDCVEYVDDYDVRNLKFSKVFRSNTISSDVPEVHNVFVTCKPNRTTGNPSQYISINRIDLTITQIQ